MRNAALFDATQLTIRDAEPADALCLSVLAMQVFLDTYASNGIRAAIAREVHANYSVAAMAAAIAAPRGVVQLAEHAGHLIGFAQTSFRAAHAQAPGGVQAELFRLYVQEPFTARGVGSALLRAAELRAAADGATVLWLTPWEHNHRALGFYARHAYEDCGLTTYCFEGEAHGNRVLAKALADRD